MRQKDIERNRERKWEWDEKIICNKSERNTEESDKMWKREGVGIRNRNIGREN